MENASEGMRASRQPIGGGYSASGEKSNVDGMRH